MENNFIFVNIFYKYTFYLNKNNSMSKLDEKLATYTATLELGDDGI